MNTAENNKLIADFMGVKSRMDGDGETLYEIEGNVGCHYAKSENLHYNNSWDRLIPVIHKLWDAPYSAGQLYDKLNVEPEVSISGGIKHHMLYGSAEQCWMGVVDLIKWNNGNKKS